MRIRRKAEFNDASLLGRHGKEMGERLGNLIDIFENPVLDVGRDRADGDDLLGDALQHRSAPQCSSGVARFQMSVPANFSKCLS